MLDFDSILWAKKYSDIQAIGLGLLIGLIVSTIIVLVAYFLG